MAYYDTHPVYFSTDAGALLTLVSKNRSILFLAPDTSENKALNHVDIDVPLELVILVGTHD